MPSATELHAVLPRGLKPQANTNVSKTLSVASGSQQILIPPLDMQEMHIALL
jgi:hypothetical protein